MNLRIRIVKCGAMSIQGIVLEAIQGFLYRTALKVFRTYVFYSHFHVVKHCRQISGRISTERIHLFGAMISQPHLTGPDYDRIA